MTYVETLLALAEALDAAGERSTALAWAREAFERAANGANESALRESARIRDDAAELVAALGAGGA